MTEKTIAEILKMYPDIPEETAEDIISLRIRPIEDEKSQGDWKVIKPWEIHGPICPEK